MLNICSGYNTNLRNISFEQNINIKSIGKSG